jgi:hypothetical protein
MTIRLHDYLERLPKKRQRAIRKRAAELITEEATLRQLRESKLEVPVSECLHGLGLDLSHPPSAGAKADVHPASTETGHFYCVKPGHFVRDDLW